MLTLSLHHATSRVYRRLSFLSLFLLVCFGSVLIVLPDIHAASASSQSSGPFHQIGTIHIPHAPASKWCYDVGWAHDGQYYLADDSLTQVDVSTIRESGQDTFFHSIGTGQFTGQKGCHDFNFSQEGPEGVLEFHHQLWVSNGNSHVLVFDVATGKLLQNIDTGGQLRADEMTVIPELHLFVVTNPDETFASPPGTPFLSFISTITYKVVGKISFPYPYSTPQLSALQQPQWDGQHLLVDIPAPSAPTANLGGEIDQITIHKEGSEEEGSEKLTFDPPKRFPLVNCSPSGLEINRESGLAAVGCAAGQQAIFNIHTGKVVAYIPVANVDIVGVIKNYFIFPSYISAQMYITNAQGKILQSIPTNGQSHTVTIDHETGQIFVPLDGGTIAVYSASSQE